MSKVLDKNGLGYYTDELCAHISGTYLPRSESVWLRGMSGSAYLEGNMVSNDPEFDREGKNVAHGYHATASGGVSHAEGYNTFAYGWASHAEGDTTIAGLAAHAEGNYTTASGDYAHAEGVGSQAAGTAAHSEGCLTTASGDNSHAEGYYTVASGDYSHAEGYRSIGHGMYSHAEGVGTYAQGTNSHAEGSYTSASGQDSHAEGVSTLAFSNGSHTEGSGSKTTIEDYAHAEGICTVADGYGSHAEGYGTAVSEDSVGGHAEGSGSIVFGSHAHAEGIGTVAVGIGSHAEGQWTRAIEYGSHAEGLQTTASSDYSHAEGYRTQTTAYYSHAEGYNTTASGECSHAGGCNTVANSQWSTAIGRWNVGYGSNESLFEVGVGYSKDDRRNAITVFSDGKVEITGLDGLSEFYKVPYTYAQYSQSAGELKPGIIYDIYDYASGCEIFLYALDSKSFCPEGWMVYRKSEAPAGVKYFVINEDDDSLQYDDSFMSDDWIIGCMGWNGYTFLLIGEPGDEEVGGPYGPDDPEFIDYAEIYFNYDGETLEYDGETYYVWHKAEIGDGTLYQAWFDEGRVDDFNWLADGDPEDYDRASMYLLTNTLNMPCDLYNPIKTANAAIKTYTCKVKYSLEPLEACTVLDYDASVAFLAGIPSGTVYWMQDDLGNEAPYDFVNIKPGGKFTFGTEDENYALDPANGVYNNRILPRYENGVQVINNVNFAVTGSHSNLVYPSCNNVSIDFKVAESMISMNSQGGLAIFNPTEFITPIAGTPLV